GAGRGGRAGRGRGGWGGGVGPAPGGAPWGAQDLPSPSFASARARVLEGRGIRDFFAVETVWLKVPLRGRSFAPCPAGRRAGHNQAAGASPFPRGRRVPAQKTRSMTIATRS